MLYHNTAPQSGAGKVTAPCRKTHRFVAELAGSQKSKNPWFG